MKLALIGCGRAGCSLALALRRGGFPIVALMDRVFPEAEKAGRFLRLGRGARLVRKPEEAVDPADIVLIATPDRAIASVARAIAKTTVCLEKKLFFHLSGALDAGVLDPLARRGAGTGSLHPLQTFPRPSRDREIFRGITIALEGSGPAVQVGKRLVKGLGARPLVVPPGKKPLYHAASVIACNYPVVLIREALGLLRRIGIPRPSAGKALRPLVLRAAQNLFDSTPEASLSGPVVRADAEVLKVHIRALREAAPELLPIYRSVGIRAVSMAFDAGFVSRAEAARLRRLFAEDKG
jgi:predicted short-subunit dehydrogenase-like oxidoreductase (DUF2520 family)